MRHLSKRIRESPKFERAMKQTKKRWREQDKKELCGFCYEYWKTTPCKHCEKCPLKYCEDAANIISVDVGSPEKDVDGRFLALLEVWEDAGYPMSFPDFAVTFKDVR